MGEGRMCINLKYRDHLEDLGVDGRRVLSASSRKKMGGPGRD
jgi:hypothetical protein